MTKSFYQSSCGTLWLGLIILFWCHWQAWPDQGEREREGVQAKSEKLYSNQNSNFKKTHIKKKLNKFLQKILFQLIFMLLCILWRLWNPQTLLSPRRSVSLFVSRWFTLVLFYFIFILILGLRLFFVGFWFVELGLNRRVWES